MKDHADLMDDLLDDWHEADSKCRKIENLVDEAMDSALMLIRQWDDGRVHFYSVSIYESDRDIEDETSIASYSSDDRDSAILIAESDARKVLWKRFKDQLDA